MVSVDLSGPSCAAFDHASPIVGPLGPLGIAMPQDKEQRTRGQGHACVRGRGPPRKATLRDALPTQPVALPVGEEQRARRARAGAEHGDGALQGGAAQGVPAHGRASIKAWANIHRCGGSQEAAVGDELQHECTATPARTTASSGSVDSGEWRHRRVPSARCRAICIVGGACGPEGAGGTSPKPREVGGTAVGDACRVARCFVRSVTRTRHCLATREGGNAEANATA